MKKIYLIALCLPFLEIEAAVPEKIPFMIDAGEFGAVENIVDNPNHGMTTLEVDSILKIMSRIRSDFRITYNEGLQVIQDKYPFVTEANIKDWISKKYIEVKEIDGKCYMFRKSVSNLDRLVPELSKFRRNELIQEDLKNEKVAINAIHSAKENGLSFPKAVTLKYTAKVKADAVPAGEMVRVWLPFPIENERQSDIKLVSSSDKVTFSKGSIHNTVYMERKAEKGKPVNFEIVVSYKIRSQYYSPEFIMNNKKEYDKSSELYRKYTATEYPQVILTSEMRKLAKQIVGRETDPLMQASLVYDWIDAHFPWAGAREYSTIPNLAEYVLENGHGDCGQVSLLYITLLRSLGIPARWESGYAVEPNKVGMHDWAEVYYEGIGWVPVDMSYGLIETAKDKNVMEFYKTGLDFHRMASNKGVGGKLSPEKKFVRSETVDFQLGEVEWSGGNLFYYKDWTPDVELIRFE